MMITFGFVWILVMVATFVIAPTNYKIATTFFVGYLSYSLGKIVARKYQYTYFTLTDSYAINDSSKMSHLEAHDDIRANA